MPTAVTYATVMERGRGSLAWRAIGRAANAALRAHGHGLRS
jgi:hypothetical protein